MQVETTRKPSKNEILEGVYLKFSRVGRNKKKRPNHQGASLEPNHVLKNRFRLATPAN
jgi:hypothetical protein